MMDNGSFITSRSYEPYERIVKKYANQAKFASQIMMYGAHRLKVCRNLSLKLVVFPATITQMNIKRKGSRLAKYSVGKTPAIKNKSANIVWRLKLSE